MQKSIIATAAVSACFFFAAPAFAQDGCPAPAAGHVKVFDGRSGEISAAQPGEPAGIDSRPGSGVLRQAPEQPAEGRVTLFIRKAGDDKRQDAQPAPGAGLRKVGAGTLQAQPSTCR